MGNFINIVLGIFLGTIIGILILVPSIIVKSIWKFVQYKSVFSSFILLAIISVAIMHYRFGHDWWYILENAGPIIGGVFLLFIYANAWSYYLIGQAQALYEDGEYIKAFVALEPLAELGRVESQLLLAKIYDLGLGVQQNNAEAFKWYNKAAEQGNIEAQDALAKFIEINSGGEYEVQKEE